MSQSTHQIKIKGVDQTGAAFSSIRKRAGSAGAQIRSMLGGAIAAAGAYMGVNRIGNTIMELGKLSDLAMKSGMSVDHLTKSSTAFKVAGLDISVQSLAKAMQYLQKNTGESGSNGFDAAMKRIAGIGDIAKRNQELVKTFGRSGLELMPLVQGGNDLIDKFSKLRDLMPGVTQSAADSGDAIADSLTILSNGAESIFQKSISKILTMWVDDLPGGVRAAALNCVSYLEWMGKRGYNIVSNWGAKIGLGFKAMWNWAANDYSWEDAWGEFGVEVDILESDQDKYLSAIDKARDEYVDKLKNTNVDDLANALGGKSVGATSAVESAMKEAAKRSPSVRNDLIMAGNEANRLALIGPQFQSEAKKQTELLKKIEENTEKVADAEEPENWSDEYKSI